MRYLLIVLMALMFTIPVQAQLWWGDEDVFVWGASFDGDTTDAGILDSLTLKKPYATQIDSGASIFTNFIPMGDEIRGTGLIAVSWDSVDAALDSALLYLRYGYNPEIQNGNAGHYGVWRQIGTYHKTDTLYIYELADSAWWQPSNGRQWKSTSGDQAADDTLGLPKISFYEN